LELTLIANIFVVCLSNICIWCWSYWCCWCAVPNDPRRVIVTKLTLVVDGRPDVDIDLTGKHLTDSA